MADGLGWDDLPIDLEGPGVAIRRKDFDGLAMWIEDYDVLTGHVKGVLAAAAQAQE